MYIEVVRPSDFVGKSQGKLRDHYRIGKILGTGKALLLVDFKLVVNLMIV